MEQSCGEDEGVTSMASMPAWGQVNVGVQDIKSESGVARVGVKWWSMACHKVLREVKSKFALRETKMCR